MIIREIHRYIEGMIREGGTNSLKAMPEYPLDELREAARAAGMIVNEHDAVMLPFKHHVIWWCDIVRALPHGDMLGVIADFRLIDDSKRDAYRSIAPRSPRACTSRDR